MLGRLSIEVAGLGSLVILAIYCFTSNYLYAQVHHKLRVDSTQVLDKVTIALGVLAGCGSLVILAVQLALDEPVGYAFVVRFRERQ